MRCRRVHLETRSGEGAHGPDGPSALVSPLSHVASAEDTYVRGSGRSIGSVGKRHKGA
jgi:hypothetical protein